MGTLVNLSTGNTAELDINTRVGRGRRNDLRLRSPSASNSHAELRWHDGGWWVRDLASTNGTFVNEASIRGDHALLVGDTIRFSMDASETWRLIDDREPDAMAWSDAGDEVRGNPLALPEDEPRYVVMASYEEATWFVQDVEAPEASAERIIHDGDQLEVGGVVWTLRLPRQMRSTLNLAARPLVKHLHLTFEVDDVQPRALEVRRPDGTCLRLPSLAFQRLLYWLAKRRLDDQSERRDQPRDGGLQVETDPELGWTSSDTLRALLGCTRQSFNVDAYRARQTFAKEVGAEDFAHIVEKRSRAGRGFEYRIGTGHLTVVDVSL